MRQNSVLIHLLCFYFNCIPDDILCKIAIWADDTALNSSCDKLSDLPQQVESMSCNLTLKIEIDGKYFYFLSATFWFWSVKICYLIWSIQGQTLKAVIQN